MDVTFSEVQIVVKGDTTLGFVNKKIMNEWKDKSIYNLKCSEFTKILFYS